MRIVGCGNFINTYNMKECKVLVGKRGKVKSGLTKKTNPDSRDMQFKVPLNRETKH
jgi:hypothetical protein